MQNVKFIQNIIPYFIRDNIRTQFKWQSYSDNQIKGKLRQYYYNTGNNIYFIMYSYEAKNTRLYNYCS
jgi:hypothetical protein